MDNMEKLAKKHNDNLLGKSNTNKIAIVARIILVPKMVNVYHQLLFIQLKFLLATINTETNILASARQNSKPDQVTLRIHLKPDKKDKDTELSKCIWGLKDKNITYSSKKWSIVKQTFGYNSITNSYNLCLPEKLVICSFRDKDRLIKKRMDLVSKRQHEKKFILSNYKPQMFPLLLLYPEILSNCQSILYNKCVVKFMIFYSVIHKLYKIYKICGSVLLIKCKFLI